MAKKNEPEAWWDDFDEDFQEAEVQESKGFSAMPDGTYQTIISDVVLDKTKDGTRYFMWKFLVLAGNYKDRTITKTVFFNTDMDREQRQRTMTYFKTDLALCGVTIDSLQGLEVSMSQLLDVRVEVAVKNKNFKKDGEMKKYTNVYINNVITGELADEDDIPF